MRNLDLRPFETVSSVAIWLALGPLAFVPGLLVLVLALIGRRIHAGPVAAGLCLLLAGIPVLFALIALFRWSRTGAARSFLAEVAAGLGGGDASFATWLLPLLSPRLEGRVDGRAFRVDLRRAAGILSPPTVGRKFLIWGWLLKVNVATRARGPKVGFGPKGAILANLFGLTGPVDVGEVRVFTGESALGRALAEDPDALARAAEILDVIGPGFVIVDGTGASVSVQLPGELSPSRATALVRALAALAARYDA